MLRPFSGLLKVMNMIINVRFPVGRRELSLSHNSRQAGDWKNPASQLASGSVEVGVPSVTLPFFSTQEFLPLSYNRHRKGQAGSYPSGSLSCHHGDGSYTDRQRSIIARFTMFTDIGGCEETQGLSSQGGTTRKLNANARPCLTYQLQGSNIKYHLPQKQLLPSVEKNEGYLSNWPGHVGGEIVQQKQAFQPSNVNRFHGFDITNVNNAPKPRFLQQLETHLRKELQVLDLSGPNAQEVTLQAYREVFEYFIEDLKTYKPLLSAIKNEYEITIAHLRNRIRELEPLKSLLVATSETCEQRIIALQEEERFEVQSLKSEKIELLDKIDYLLRVQNSLEAQVRKLQEELAAEYERYREQHDARKLLISDMNNLRYQQEKSKDSHTEEAEAVEDTVKLKLALKVAREDLKALQVELNAMKAEYGDVIPRRDFEALDKNYNELSEKGTGEDVIAYLRHDGLIKNVNLAKESITKVLKEVWKEKMASDLQSGTRSSLPEFFHNFLQKKYGDSALLWAYNIYYGCRNHQKDEFISLFFSILNGIVDESVYHGQIEHIAHVLEQLNHSDTSRKGILSKQEFSQTLKTALPNKNEKYIQELIVAATTQLGDEKKIKYNTLFEENTEGTAGAFIALLQTQYTAEKTIYLDELRKALEDKEELTEADLKKAFQTIDPSIDPQTLATYLAQGFQTTKEQLDQATAVDTDTVLDRLQASDIKRVGPRK
ncbi:translin-associated factor X-interacting protein 1 isoform X2 [Hemiscyllium ocellatum]|uniref:translin-associated factor X-interacting protein 1 isoform X2 n=1 Tax=Hemiscyllium ocellatum TaxID=170820 RepID=UPI00296736C5|nr:translin-associated factor X-interacting protein 1 isoform X2 [Hemiscyllium ocellatum]